MKYLCWNLEMVQVIPGKYLLQTRKGIGFPPAPASTNWENHHFVSMWSPPDTSTKLHFATLPDSKSSYKHTESWLCDWKPWEEARVVFLPQSGCKDRRGNCPVPTVFSEHQLSFLFQLQGQREPLKEDQAWLSWSSKLLQLLILWTYWALGFSLFPPYNICLLLDGGKRRCFLLQLPYLRHLQPLC